MWYNIVFATNFMHLLNQYVKVQFRFQNMDILTKLWPFFALVYSLVESLMKFDLLICICFGFRSNKQGRQKYVCASLSGIT